MISTAVSRPSRGKGQAKTALSAFDDFTTVAASFTADTSSGASNGAGELRSTGLIASARAGLQTQTAFAYETEGNATGCFDFAQHDSRRILPRALVLYSSSGVGGTG